ncbi:Rhodanese-like domain-containing protein [Xylariales sp. PMI_506]|nr:Rhodanese-like domain-containing protein [Xylariales sp. PMI_506]
MASKILSQGSSALRVSCTRLTSSPSSSSAAAAAAASIPRTLRSFATASSRVACRQNITGPAQRVSCISLSPVEFGRLRHLGGVRWSTESATGSKIYTFEEIQDISSGESASAAADNVTIIDVREPGELASTGRIPGALNVPITTSPDGFHISDEEFSDRFGFERPPRDRELIFYCKAGVRSRAAAALAREAGFARVGEFPGSWLEWSGKGGAVERS